MSQVKDDVKFIKDRSVIRDEQMSIFQSQMTAMQSSSLRIEMLLRGDYGSEGLVQQMASVKGQVSEHDKKLVWAAAAIATVGVIFEILMKLYGK